ncbi:MAG: DUF4231 domain-containing protein [Rhodospirillales bacterium]|nr:DUF4231 domain-containing protein [Rhodospirillales bacterium]
MTKITYPAIYEAADKGSKSAQSWYLTLVRFEYLFLIILAILSMELFNSELYYFGFVMVLLTSLAILFWMWFRKPEQAWYRCRALAESIKTISWRYMMRSEPFEDAQSVSVPRSELRNILKGLLYNNENLGEHIIQRDDQLDQVTHEMDTVRESELERRKHIYLEERIKEQRLWYTKKASSNKKSYKCWMCFCVLIYVAAFFLIILRAMYWDESWQIWPLEPLIVIASAIVGWIQIKKFNELTAAYTLTAHEIGFLQAGISEINNEKELSDFVNEAELAFSREHTQWKARQSS